MLQKAFHLSSGIDVQFLVVRVVNAMSHQIFALLSMYVPTQYKRTRQLQEISANENNTSGSSSFDRIAFERHSAEADAARLAFYKLQVCMSAGCLVYYSLLPCLFITHVVGTDGMSPGS